MRFILALSLFAVGARAQFEAKIAPSLDDSSMPGVREASISGAPAAVSIAVFPAASLEDGAPALAAAPAAAAPAAVAAARVPSARAQARALAQSSSRSLAASSAAAMDGSKAPAGAAAEGRALARAGKAQILKLRPTQMSVGLREVDKKIAKLKSRDGKKYLKSMPVPIVLGPRGHVYMIDHHHLARAAWEAGYKRVHTTLVADLSKLSDAQFWKTMKEKKWVYPYDQLGGGPHNPIDLPENVRGMADDPYRSVAGEVRERGGYRKSEAPFSEFLWAQFFRSHLTVHPVYHGFEQAMAQAMRLARSRAARRLPGWIGDKKK